MALGLQDKLYIGNLNAKRDWGHAKDYVEAMWLILQQKEPEDFVIATGVTTSVRDFISMAFSEVGVEVEFLGSGVNEIGRVKSSSDPICFPTGKEVVRVDPTYFRPTEVDLLIGDPAKANTKLGWKPKYTLADMVKEMVAADLLTFQKNKVLKEAGFTVLRQFE